MTGSRRIDRVINIFEVCDVNPFGPVALEAAYNESEDWLDALNAYIFDNYNFLKDTLRRELPQLSVTRLEGTYLVWVNTSSLGLPSDVIADRLLRDGRVMVSAGTMYGEKDGRDYIRLNIACPRATLEEGLRRIAATLKSLVK